MTAPSDTTLYERLMVIGKPYVTHNCHGNAAIGVIHRQIFSSGEIGAR